MTMDKTAELALSDRLAEITGAASGHRKVAELANGEPVRAHGESEEEAVIEKIASMPIDELVENEHFVAGFQERVAERMPEIDDAFDRVVGVE